MNKNREIKFRFWNKIARRFQPASKYAIDVGGIEMIWSSEWYRKRAVRELKNIDIQVDTYEM